MASFLFAWELGGDYGHLSRLLPVARELEARGHNCLFVVRDLLGAEAILTPHQMKAFQAPLWLGQVTKLPDPISYPEMLMRFGFLNARALTGICRAWRNLLEVLRPDVLILDHAPTALLATRALALPKLNFGDGFCIPPRVRPLPHFRWWQRENMVRLADSEQHALAVANEVLLTLDAPPMGCLADLLDCADTLLCTFAELDHYPGRGSQDYIGPIFALGQGAEVAWPRTDGPKIFAYLKPGYSGLENILATLKASSASVLAHVPGAARKTLLQHSSSSMTFSTTPLDMGQIGASCDLALCHGGGGTTAALLLAGKPMMLFPMHMEQTMTARRLVAMGAAASVLPDGTGQLPRLLKKTMADPALLKAAQGFASAHAGYDQHASIRLAADRCEALLKPAA
jgi:UDP-N-acetylglucosamine:LPS N-acetylglucosamine transferase